VWHKRGTGVPPVKNHGQEGHATAHDQDGHATLKVRHGAYLPHWTRDGAIYAVNFRLADSLPKPVLESWKFERKDIIKTARQMKRPLSASEEERLDKLFSEKVEKYLDEGRGACWMRRDEVAARVAGALEHFDGKRYRLAAWCIMPNHVHAIVQPLAGFELPGILHSWKSFSSKEANRVIGRTGEFWQPEYYDHLVRDEKDFARQIEYVLSNPRRAGLTNWKWVGCGTGGTGVPPVEAHAARGTGVPPVKHHGQEGHATTHGQDGHATSHATSTRKLPEEAKE